MLTLATGKKSFPDWETGYTLLEVIAVIAVVGLITLILAAPGYLLDAEKTRIQYAGKLIRADLAASRLQARIDSITIPVEFDTAGYHFRIGGTLISRHFTEDHFTFVITPEQNDQEEAAGTEPVPPSSSPEITPALNDESGPDATDDIAAEPKKNLPERANILEFNQDGLKTDLSLPWTTDHFKGSLDVKQDGTVEWTYAQR